MDAVREIAIKAKSDIIKIEDINDKLLSDHLYTREIPDPDLLIRTSGELRLSNFLLWQLAYTEIFVTPVYWPAFRSKELFEAIQNYQKRERRFGLTSDQIKIEELGK